MDTTQFEKIKSIQKDIDEIVEKENERIRVFSGKNSEYKIAVKTKNHILHMFFVWLNNEYPDLIYFSNLYWELGHKKHEYFTFFKSLYSPDGIILHSNKSFKGFAFYLFMKSESVMNKNEKIVQVKRLREQGYFAIAAKSIDELKAYFTEYINYDESVINE